MENVTLRIEGMHCQGCVSSVTRVLQSLDGVGEVQVSLEQSQAKVSFDAGKTSVATLRSAIEDAGYTASTM